MKTAEKPNPAREGGQRLKAAIHVARARTTIPSDNQLAIAAHVHYDTLMNWYSGRTTPRPGEVRKVAAVLDVSYSDLLAAYDGRDPEPMPLQDAIRDLVTELRSFLEEERRLRSDQAAVIASLVRTLGGDDGASSAEDPDPELERVAGG